MQFNESDDEADLQYLQSLADDEESDDKIDVLLLPFLKMSIKETLLYFGSDGTAPTWSI